MLFFIYHTLPHCCPSGNLNTSHVILYPKLVYADKPEYAYLNTSHVILYLSLHLRYHKILLFKYISCYSLSDAWWTAQYEYDAFKYISCYSLSKTPQQDEIERRDLNTSHVILYPGQFQHLHPWNEI